MERISPERWRQVKQLFLAALDRPPDERAALLAQSCGEDAELLAAVQSLLEHHDRAEAAGFLDQPAAPEAASAAIPDTPSLREPSVATPHREARTAPIAHPRMLPGSPPRLDELGEVNDYELLEEIGRGGMGVVYKARQKSLDRVVALKMVLSGPFASPEVVQRFRAEAAAAANLDHPGIVPIFEVGYCRGQHYYSMGFVPGQSLAQRIAGGPLAPREAAEVVRKAAAAVHHAHSKGVVHRDLKPANILLDAQGEPRVADFGLAKRLADPSGLTQSGQVMGTPGYLSPEQAVGDREIGPASDVYGLGAILYAALTGRPPFEAASDMATLRAIGQSEPVPPGRINPAVDRDLETICLKCLRKDPADRYASAEDLAEDLGRWLADEPIRARPAGPLARARRWQRQNRVAVAWVFAMLVALGGAATAAAYFWGPVAWIPPPEVSPANQPQPKQEADVWRYQESLTAAKTALDEGRLQDAADVLAAVPEGQRGWETQRLAYEASLRPAAVRQMAEHTGGVIAADLSPDGTRLATAGGDGLLLIWDVAHGRVQRHLAKGRWSDQKRRWLHYVEDDDTPAKPGTGPEYVAAVRWLPDSVRLATASLRGQGVVINTKTGRRQVLLEGSQPLYCVAAAEDGRLLFGGAAGTVFLRHADAQAGQDARQEIGAVAITAAAWSREARMWIVGSADGTVQTLDGATLRPLGQARLPGPIWCLDTAARDGAIVAAGCQSPQAALFRLRSGGELRPLGPPALPVGKEPARAIQALRFHTGKLLYTLDDRGNCGQLNLPEGRVPWWVPMAPRGAAVAELLVAGRRMGKELPPAFQRQSAAVLPSPDGDLLVTAGQDSFARVWSVARQTGLTELHVGPGPRIAFHRPNPQEQAGAELLWAAGRDGNLRLMASGKRRELASVPAHGPGAMDLAVLPSGGTVATAGQDGQIRFWSAKGDKIERGKLEIRHGRALVSVAASHDGKWVAAGDCEGGVGLWEIATGRRVAYRAEPDKPHTDAGRLAFNCDDTRLAVLRRPRGFDVNAIPSLVPLEPRPMFPAATPTSLLWSPKDRDWLVVGDDQRRYVEAWLDSDPATWRQLPRAGSAQLPCVAMAADPAGRRWFFLEQGGRLVVHDPLHLGEVLVRQTGGTNACDLALDPAGNRLAAALEDGTVKLFETGGK